VVKSPIFYIFMENNDANHTFQRREKDYTQGLRGQGVEGIRDGGDMVYFSSGSGKISYPRNHECPMPPVPEARHPGEKNFKICFRAHEQR
jgi:hypothetical protein